MSNSYSEGLRLLEAFKDMLPVSLGEAHVISTPGRPWTFVAFYSSICHEMKDGRIIEGNEFRLWTPSKGFRRGKVLAGIIGIYHDDYTLALVALSDQNTNAQEIAPYASMIRKMMSAAASGDIGRMSQ